MPVLEGSISAVLRESIAREVSRPAPGAARILTDAILERHQGAVSAVIFYGSCLRKASHEGVLDFYVVVDSYRAAYEGRILAWINAAVPPNVFYLEHESELGTLRTKYAVISQRDLERGVTSRCIHPYFWARFAQPVLATYVRDDDAREWTVRVAATAIVTLVQRLSPFLPAQGRRQRFSLTALWQEAFRRTYAAELRTEPPETVRSNYEADAERYDLAGGEAIAMLGARGWFDRVDVRPGAAEVEMSPWRRRKIRFRWHVGRVVAKSLAVVRLVKNAHTFGDWLPYVLWKIERHTGAKVELTPRQRRRPLLFGLPVLVRLIARGSLH